MTTLPRSRVRPPVARRKRLERVNGFEPSTSTLASKPQSRNRWSVRAAQCDVVRVIVREARRRRYETSAHWGLLVEEVCVPASLKSVVLGRCRILPETRSKLVLTMTTPNTESTTSPSINLQRLLPLSRAAKLLPGKPHASTLWRWARIGIRIGGCRIHLRVHRLGSGPPARSTAR